MNKLRALALLMALSLLMGGCATVTRGSLDGLEVTSDPAGAEISVVRTDRGFTKKEIRENQHLQSAREIMASGEFKDSREFNQPLTAVTPANLNLARKGQYEISIEKAGYDSHQVAVTGSVSGKGSAGMAGNVLLGGVIGMGVDAASGAMKDLAPNPVHVDMMEAPRDSLAGGVADDVADELGDSSQAVDAVAGGQ